VGTPVSLQASAIVAGMETWDAIRARRNVREFADRPIAEPDLDRILDAGRRAPSSRNWQPWDFVLVTDRAQLAELANVWRGAGHVARAAAAIVCLGPVIDDARQNAWLQYDHGQATMSMALVAADLGIGSSHAAVADQALARICVAGPVDCEQDAACEVAEAESEEAEAECEAVEAALDPPTSR
jgi:nitroreductase